MPTRYVHSALRLTHYWWPLVVGWSLLLVVHRALHRPWNPGGAAMLLLGIMAAYSWDRLLDPPATELTAGLRRTLALAAFAASAAGALHLATLPAATAPLVPLIGAAVLLYPTVKRFPATKTVFVPLVWTWCAIALPFGDGSWLGWRALLQPIALPLFLLLGANALLCDVSDEPDDRRRGVATLPVMVGTRAATALAAALAIAGGVAAHAEQRLGLVCSALALGLAALTPRLLAIDLIGPLAADVALALPGLLIIAHVV